MFRSSSRDSSSRKRKITPPSPSYMDNDQFAAYLAGLRDNRASRPSSANRPSGVSRPSGARPLPSSSSSHRGPSDPSVAASISSQADLTSQHQRVPSDSTKQHPGRPSFAGSVASRRSINTTISGKDYYPEKLSVTAPPAASEVVPSATYMERGQRWMEKEEVVSLRQAMEDMDVKDPVGAPSGNDESTKLFDAAQNEASELVWQHQHGVQPPAPGTPYRYKPHLRKNSYAHARAASIGRYGGDVGATGLARDSTIRSFSGSSSGSDGRSSPESNLPRESLDSTRSRTQSGRPVAVRTSSGHQRRSSMKRNISGEIQRPFSGDQIWEEPESSTPEHNPRQPRMPTASQPLGTRTRAPLASNSNSDNTDEEKGPASKPGFEPVLEHSLTKPLSRSEIHKNPPTQSRNPKYMTNSPFNRRSREDVPTKNGIEIRADDIRQATSMRLKDRSAKLPTPSAVSDSPGRPIVSFDTTWKAPEEATDSKPEESGGICHKLARNSAGQIPATTHVPAVTVTPDISNSQPPTRPFGPPAIPSIQVDQANEANDIPSIAISGSEGLDSPAVPTIVLPGEEPQETGRPASIPTIVMPGDDNQSGNNHGGRTSTRPLPTPQAAARAHPHTKAGGDRSSGHWSRAPAPTGTRATAACHECRYPIEGRFIALRGASERFHPQCFRCHMCGTGLEALEISPEPDEFRAERLDRIRRREAGEVMDEAPGQTMAEDGDDRLRFYCHLDWHELFAPRCNHCKTPILGDHLVALGQHWHYGHFFCAECGDPFEQGKTHIEKDGYAWCVNCQTRRTERRAPKCKRCKKAVIGQYVQALGGEWHDECFRCATCNGGFDDGQIFPVERRTGSTVLCTKCRSAELKM